MAAKRMNPAAKNARMKGGGKSGEKAAAEFGGKASRKTAVELGGKTAGKAGPKTDKPKGQRTELPSDVLCSLQDSRTPGAEFRDSIETDGTIRTMTAAVRDFHPDHVFDCGQCFRWNREADGSYTGIAGGEIAKISFSCGKEDGAGCLTVSGAAQTSALTDDEWKAHWFDYLDLHRDYGEIKRQLCSGDPVMEEAVSFGSGIRLLRQDPWEAVICFIISQNNNIPRIKKCVESLCRTWGEYRGEFCGKEYYDYPSPEVLASLTAEDLAPCRLGYRAKYLTAAGRMAAEQGRQQLNGLRDEAVSYREAFERICRFPGVGPKVANCILLFSLGKYESFPLDVWMKKVMTRRYGISDVREMETFAREHFGKYGGFAQQYLFYCEKEKGQPEKAKIEKI